jgi:hypothetical protein
MIWETIIGDVDIFLWTKDFKKFFYPLLEFLTISLELLQLFVEVVIQGHFDCFVTMLTGDDLKNIESIFDMVNCIIFFFHPWVLLKIFCNMNQEIIVNVVDMFLLIENWRNFVVIFGESFLWFFWIV